MKDKILVISVNNLAKGGVASVVTTFMQSEYLNSNFDIHYFHSHDPKNFITKWISWIISVIYFPFLLLSGKFRVAHIHGSLKGSLFRKSFFLLWLKLFKVPTIYQCHAAQVEKYFNSKSEFQLKVIRVIFSLFTLRLCLGKKSVGLFEDKTNSKWDVLFNPVPDITVLREKQDTCNFTFMGELTKRKGIDDLLEAFSQCNNEHARLLVAGNGDIDTFKERCRTLGIENKVDFLGWINNSEKLQLLAKTDVVVLPSYAEGLPMSILEAMSVGLPVITTPVGAVEDAITARTHGLLIEPGNINDLCSALNELISDNEKREYLGNNAKSKFKQYFEVDVVAKKLAEYYTELIPES